MMRPQPRACIPGSDARMVWKDEHRLTAMMASHRSTGKLSTGETCWIPALLTRMSTFPRRFSASATSCGALFAFGKISPVVQRCHAKFFSIPARIFSISQGSPNPFSMMSQPSARQPARNTEADSAGRTGNDCHTSFQHRDSPLLLWARPRCERSRFLCVAAMVHSKPGAAGRIIMRDKANRRGRGHKRRFAKTSRDHVWCFRRAACLTRKGHARQSPVTIAYPRPN